MTPLVRIALRNVLRNRRRSLITLFAVFFALTVMTFVRGVLNGLQASIREGVIHGQVGALQVHRKGYLKAMQGGLDLDLPADEAFLAKIRAVPHVRAASARIPFGGMVNAHDETVFALFSAVDPAHETDVCPRRWERLTGGSPLTVGSPTGAVLSDALTQRLASRRGDTVALLTNDRDGVLNAGEVKIDGTFAQLGLFATEKNMASVPLAVAQELLRMPGRATEIAVSVDDLARVDQVVAAVQQVVGPEYEVSSWHDVASWVDDVIKGQNFALGFIFYTFFFIALIGITNTMFMSVRERTREIGTMMAVGVRRRQVLALFLLEAAIIGLAGGVLGTAAGGSLVWHYGATGLHIRAMGQATQLTFYPFITAAFVAGIFVAATLGAAVAALLPAWRASRLRPIEALGATA